MTGVAKTDRLQPIAAASRTRGSWLFIGLTLFILLFFALSLSLGRVPLAFFEALGALLEGEDTLGAIVLYEIRLPRALLALMVGATLGLTGAALQGYLRNPLAETGIIGVSASAAIGSVLVFYYGLAAVFPLALPLGGMAGAFVAVLLMHLLAGRQGSALGLILAGVAVNSLAAALTALALNLAPNPFAVTEIIFWLLGSLADRSFTHVALAAPLMALGGLVMLTLGRALDALSLGEETAESLGVDLGALRLRLILGTALGVGAAVSVAGAIGFVGLIVPHLLRPLVGHRPRLLLPASALGGAALTLVWDIAVRFAPFGPELRLGVFTALIGAPFFFYLVIRLRRETW